jgi:hypothetical protein
MQYTSTPIIWSFVLLYVGMYIHACIGKKKKQTFLYLAFSAENLHKQNCVQQLHNANILALTLYAIHDRPIFQVNIAQPYLT